MTQPNIQWRWICQERMSSSSLLWLLELKRRRKWGKGRRRRKHWERAVFSLLAVGDVIGVFWNQRQQQTVDVSVQVCSHSNTGLEENNWKKKKKTEPLYRLLPLLEIHTRPCLRSFLLLCTFCCFIILSGDSQWSHPSCKFEFSSHVFSVSLHSSSLTFTFTSVRRGTPGFSLSTCLILCQRPSICGHVVVDFRLLIFLDHLWMWSE